MTDFVTKYGRDGHLVEYIKRDICAELMEMYEGVTMKPNDDIMDLLVSIVDRTGEKFVKLFGDNDDPLIVHIWKI